MRAIVITLAVAALALSGCGGDDETATDSSPPTSTTQATTEQTTTEETTTEETTATTAAPNTAEELEDCLRDAGAKLASSPADLRFAAGSAIGGDVQTGISTERGNLRMYSLRPSGGDGWRIYAAARRRAGDAPGISDLLSDPRAAVVIAYVNPANRSTIRKANACMTG